MQVNTLTKKLPLSLLPCEVFGLLTTNGRTSHTALLETAEPGTQKSKRSISMVSAAAVIEGLDGTVTIKSLNDNGKSFIRALAKSDGVPAGFTQDASSEVITYTLNEGNYGNGFYESQRLTQPTIADVLTLITEQIQCNQKADNVSSCLIGAMSFDLVDQYEALPSLNKTTPDFKFYLADQLVIQEDDSQSAKIIVKGFGDNATNTVRLGVAIDSIESKLLSSSKTPSLIATSMSHTFTPLQSSDFKIDVTDEQFAGKVEKIKQRIIEGDAFQVVLSRTFSTECDDAFKAYQVLRKSNPGPYMYYINFADSQLFGSSPESALKVFDNSKVTLYPIAGTRKRAITESGAINFELDAKTEFELISDEKEGAEHMMLVDLARNDLAKVIKAGSRQVTQLKRIVKYSNVMHMVSEVIGELRDDINPMHAYRACANMGTLTGAPKIKAVEIIRELEQKPRGYYGGAVSIYNANQEFDSAIIIRSAEVADGVAKVSAGAGIVYDSKPELEANETFHKAKAVLNACQLAEQEINEQDINENLKEKSKESAA
ncbi:anthranilate synthase component 1 [Kangiella koreensis]|uniref:anthranilate synthase n=1 Tax=Kangiella koreensis (strain DSM 16069 / JCM 12317 / KCTC 12182 / SW-125) TaxID=523791 RepID=C7RCR7_KANKD|nr:anthranilate synthase component 1 [Kangiella koreensis]ACV27059.1 chorismate binding-like protein [Kangiella koreensis DSM 16069]